MDFGTHIKFVHNYIVRCTRQPQSKQLKEKKLQIQRDARSQVRTEKSFSGKNVCFPESETTVFHRNHWQSVSLWFTMKALQWRKTIMYSNIMKPNISPSQPTLVQWTRWGLTRMTSCNLLSISNTKRTPDLPAILQIKAQHQPPT